MGDLSSNSSISLGIRVSQDSFKRVQLETVDLDGQVEEFRKEAAQQAGLAPDQTLLIHGGVALEDKKTLRSSGIRPGVMIHVLRKKMKEAPIVPKTMNEKEMQQLALAFRTFALNPSFRSTLHRLSRPEVLENIILSTPGLSQDPVAVSIIRDPELLVHMSDLNTIRRVMEMHPVLPEAANHIAAAVHEETAAAHHSRRNEGTPASSSSAFSLDALSGGEEMDSSQSSDSPPPRSSSSGITSSQLAAALAAVGPGAAGTPGSRPSAVDDLITHEMFNRALQQAFQGIVVPGPPGSSSASTPNRSGVAPLGENPYALAERMSQQLQQMRELGLRDQVFNLQALQITNGDVQAAIELVMSSGGGGREEGDDQDPYQ